MVYLKQEKLEIALEKISESQAIYKKNKKGNSMQMAWTFVNIGKAKQAESKLKEAQENYEMSLEIIEKYKGKYSVEAAYVLRRLSSVCLEMGNMGMES